MIIKGNGAIHTIVIYTLHGSDKMRTHISSSLVKDGVVTEAISVYYDCDTLYKWRLCNKENF